MTGVAIWTVLAIVYSTEAAILVLTSRFQFGVLMAMAAVLAAILSNLYELDPDGW